MSGVYARASIIVLAVATGACPRSDSATDAPRALTMVEITSDQPGASAVAVDATHVYWNHVGSGTVRKAPRTGGEITTLYDDQSQGSAGGGRSIALDRDHVYFDDGFALRRVPKAGGPPETVGKLPILPAWVTADGDGAYSLGIRGVSSHSEGETNTTPSSEPEPCDLAVDATHLYWAGSQGVRTMPKGGGEVETLVEGPFSLGLCSLALSETHVFYWRSGTDRGVHAVPKSGGASKLLASTYRPPADMAVGQGVLYVLEGSGQVLGVDLASGDVERFKVYVPGGGVSSSWGGLAVDGDHIFAARGGAYFGGPVHIDLTKPNAGSEVPPPKYSGAVVALRLGPAQD
ncbi:MAG: hypothetical protein AAF500_14235 [Myxococcota bacterium]